MSHSERLRRLIDKLVPAGEVAGDVGRVLRHRFESAATAAGIEVDALVEPIEAKLEPTTTLEDVELMRIEELAFATACVRGVPAAVERFKQDFSPAIRQSVRRVASNDARVDDLVHHCMVWLLTATGGGPRLERYGGRGSLEGWVRVACAREALAREVAANNLREVSFENAAPVMITQQNPELDHLRRQYAEAFSDAFRNCFAALTPRDRNLLRMTLIDGLTVDELSTMHDVHRATVARWVQDARESLATNVRRSLQHSLKLSASDMENVALLVRSTFDANLSTLLRTRMQ